MKGNKVMKIATLACGLVATAAAYAAPPPGTVEVETDCFEMVLPKGWELVKRNKFDKSRSYYGAWTYASPNRLQKVFVRCSRFNPSPIQAAFNRSLGHLKRSVKDLKPFQPPKFEKDEKGRSIGSYVGHGFMQAKDLKTGKIMGVPHIIARILQQLPKRNLQIAITVAVTGTRADAIEKIMDLITEHFDPIDAAEKAKLKAQAAKPAPKPAVQKR